MKTRPIIYAGASIFVACALFDVVFPGFVDTYAESGGRLPAITRFAIDASDGYLVYIWAALFALAAFAVVALGITQFEENARERRGVGVVVAAAVTAVMMAVAVVFLAAIITPMISINA